MIGSVSRLIVLALSTTVVLFAQSNLSTVRGTANDPAGAAVLGAHISIVNVETNIERIVLTNSSGDYEIPDLKQGTYRLTATHPGFSAFVAEGLILESSQIRRVDIVLKVGAIESQVTVSASAAVIETDTPKIGAGVTQKRYEDTPIGRNFGEPRFQLATLPNVQTTGAGSNVMFAGQQPAQIQEGMDGLKTDGPTNQIAKMDEVEEVQAVTVNNSAEVSRIGYFNLVTKSGTNQFHGGAYYYWENSALDARHFFSPTKLKELLHTIGANVSGPIFKNRTFFYASWYGQRIPSQSFYLKNVPTAAMRSGDFSQLAPLGTTLRDPLTGTPFPNNVIPANRLSATSLKVQDAFMPAPNLGGTGALNRNYGFVFPYPTDLYRTDYLTQRIDHKISDKNTIFGRFMSRFTPYVLPGNYPGLAWTRVRRHNQLVINDTHIFSPALVNTFRFGWMRDHIDDGNTVDGFQPLNGAQVVGNVGLQGVNPKSLSAEGFPTMNITGYDPLTVQPGGTTQNDRNFAYADNLTWSQGKHVWKFGAEIRTFRNVNGSVPDGTFGSFAFNGSLSGNAYADFLLGYPFTSSRLNPLVNRVRVDRETGIFAQDTFKVSSRLTLEYGIRWDYFGPARYDDGLMYNWDPNTGNVIVPQSAMNSISALYPSTIHIVSGDAVRNPKKTNFVPRVGAAYRIHKDTVIRGGYGIFTETLGTYAATQGGGPFQLTEAFFNNSPGQALFGFPNPFPAGIGTAPSQSVAGYARDANNGHIQQFNISVERQFHDTGFRISYIGSRGGGLNYNAPNINKPAPSPTPFASSRVPFPQFVSSSYLYSDGRTKYNSVQLEAQRKVSRDLTFDMHWTLAHSMSNFLDLENPYDRLFWNRDQFVPRQRFVLNAVYELPVGRGSRFLTHVPAVLNQIIGGWQLYWLGYLQTGQFFTPSFSGSDPTGTNTFGGLPDRIANGNLPSGQRRIDHWFDPSAFRVPAPGHFGNSGVNILEGPGLNSQSLSIGKRFALTERVHLRYLAAISNLFNHPNFTFPAANISVPGQAGVISADYGEFGIEQGARRRIEMRLRLEF